MIIEMRTYKTKPGKRADPDTFFFMRGFPDLESREPMKAMFYDGELWKAELEGVLLPMLERYDVVLVEGPKEIALR